MNKFYYTFNEIFNSVKNKKNATLKNTRFIWKLVMSYFFLIRTEWFKFYFSVFMETISRCCYYRSNYYLYYIYFYKVYIKYQKKKSFKHNLNENKL